MNVASPHEHGILPWGCCGWPHYPTAYPVTSPDQTPKCHRHLRVRVHRRKSGGCPHRPLPGMDLSSPCTLRPTWAPCPYCWVGLGRAPPLPPGISFEARWGDAQPGPALPSMGWQCWDPTWHPAKPYGAASTKRWWRGKELNFTPGQILWNRTGGWNQTINNERRSSFSGVVRGCSSLCKELGLARSPRAGAGQASPLCTYK